MLTLYELGELLGYAKTAAATVPMPNSVIALCERVNAAMAVRRAGLPPSRQYFPPKKDLHDDSASDTACHAQKTGKFEHVLEHIQSLETRIPATSENQHVMDRPIIVAPEPPKKERKPREWKAGALERMQERGRQMAAIAKAKKALNKMPDNKYDETLPRGHAEDLRDFQVPEPIGEEIDEEEIEEYKPLQSMD